MFTMEKTYFDPDDKAAVVHGLADVLSHIPAMKDVRIEYGVLHHDDFAPMDKHDPSMPGTEAVRFTKGQGDDAIEYYQSLAGDSQVAVFHDMANKLAAIMF